MRLWEGFGQKMKSQFGHQREGGREYCVCLLREVLFLIAPSGGLFRPSNIY